MDSFPEGGLRAWATVAGGFCNLFVSWGFFNAFGIFQNYLYTHQLQGYSQSDISWIGGIQSFCLFAGGLVIGQLFDAYGPLYLLICGGLCSVVSLMLLSICTKYWQIFLTLGLLTGVGAALLFYPSISIINHYFFKKRGIAAGIVVSGSGLGGIIFPILLSNSIANRHLGYGWAVRIAGFIMLALCSIAVVCVRPRMPRKPFKSLIDVTAFHDAPFMVFATGQIFLMWGLFIAFFYVAPYGQYRGSSEQMSNYYISILNAGSIFGRLIPGYFADKYGRFQVIIAATLSTAILNMALWYNAKGSAAIIVFAALYGFCSGACISLMFPCIAMMSPVRLIGTRGGMAFAGASFAALTGGPIAGAIINGKTGWHGAIAFSFVCLVCAALLQTLSWILLTRKLAVEAQTASNEQESPQEVNDQETNDPSNDAMDV